MRYKGHSERVSFAVCSLGRKSIIIGYTWLRDHNPEVDWVKGTVELTRCPPVCEFSLPPATPSTPKLRKVTVTSVEEEEEDDDDTENAEDVCSAEFGTSDDQDIPDKDDRVFVCLLRPDGIDINATGSVSTHLAEEARAKEVPKMFEESVPKQFHDFRDVFSKESFDKLPERRPWDHAIELIPGADARAPPKVYPLSLSEQSELDAFLKENLESGRIRPSKSPIASPVFFVKKKDGKLRFVQDYRKLNAVTIKNRYPLPLISDVIVKLRNGRYFTKLDVRWGYNNIRVKEGDEWKAAFRTNRGLFEPLVMFFGLTNSPATFQTMMNDLFRELIDEGLVIVYMDDILIFTEDLKSHDAAVRRVLAILRSNQLYLRSDKCEFRQPEIEYLGLIIGFGQIRMDPVKVAGVAQWPVPRNVTEVQSFLGFCNFYRRFIDHFSEMATPLNSLTRKSTPWIWGEQEAQAFADLKDAITSEPVLIFPDDSRQFRVKADCSGRASGAELSQIGSDNVWRPVAFMSKSLSETERNYEIHDKEMLAIIRALKEWRHYLEGAAKQFIVLTDHKNLEYFRTAQKLNRRQARWSIFLQQFDFDLQHRPGKQMGIPDALSRRSDHGDGAEDNENMVLLKPEYFRIRANERGHLYIAGEEKEILRRIRNASDLDEQVAKAAANLKRSKVDTVRGDEWALESNLILHRGKVYVPKDKDLRRDIVQLHHDLPHAGHSGRWKTLEQVARNYWWPGMSRYIGQYTKTCDHCNRTKVYPAKPPGRLLPNAIPSRRWGTVTVDYIPGLPECKGWDSIFVAVDRKTKRICIAPTTVEVTAPGTARLFRDNVWRHHGLADEIISDRGVHFVAEFMRELNRLLGIKTSASTAYHPESDGQTERVNQEVEQYLRLFVNYRQNDWVDWLPAAEFAINNRVHASTRLTPFFADTGRHPRTGVEPQLASQVQEVNDLVTTMKEVDAECEAALVQAAEDMARFYDAHHGPTPEYAVGDLVWLSSKNVKTTRPMAKLSDKWLGPFPVLAKVNANAYRLQLPSDWKIWNVFHVVLLHKHHGDTLGRATPERPLPEVLPDGAEIFEAERIDDSRMHYRKLQYLVKWKGYPDSERTWEPCDNLEGSPDLIQDFHEANPNAPKKIAAAVFDQLPFRRWENLTIPDNWDAESWERCFVKPTRSMPLYSWTEGALCRDDTSKEGGDVRGQLNFPLTVPSSPEGPTPPTSTVQLFATTSRLSPRCISYSEALRPTPKPPELPDLVGA